VFDHSRQRRKKEVKGVKTLGLYLSEFVVILVAAVFAFSFGRTGEVVRDLRQALAKVRTVVNRRKLREIEELRWAPFAAAATIGPLVLSRLTQTERLLPEQAIPAMLVLAAALIAGYFAFLQKRDRT
jgi:hypothetical protein